MSRPIIILVSEFSITHKTELSRYIIIFFEFITVKIYFSIKYENENIAQLFLWVPKSWKINICIKHARSQGKVDGGIASLDSIVAPSRIFQNILFDM